MKSLSRILGLSTILAFAAQPAAAQELNLKLADTMPVGHTIHQYVTAAFISEVERASDGKIKLTHYPGGQLGKGGDVLRLVQNGLQDIGLIVPSNVSDKMPLSSVAELPGLWSDVCQVADALWEMSREGGTLYESEFRPNGVRPLAFSPLPGYQVILTTSRQVSGIKDLAGLKLRATGAALERAVSSLGAVPIRMAAPEMHEALSRGTIDGALFAYQAATSYSLEGMIKTSTVDQSLGTIVSFYAISDSKWNSLGEEVQSILLTAGEKATKEGCVGINKAELEAKQLIADAGATFISLDDEDVARMDAIVGEVSQQWAGELDRRGKQGTETLEAFLKALE